MVTPVIDFHIHTVFYEQYSNSVIEWIKSLHGADEWEKLYSLYQDPGRFCEYLHQCGIDYGVILAELSPATTGTCSNEYVLDFCSGYPSLIPFASINPFMTTDMGAELSRLVELVSRLKMYPTTNIFIPMIILYIHFMPWLKNCRSLCSIPVHLFLKMRD